MMDSTQSRGLAATYVYIIDRPGHDLDGEDTLVYASSRAEADAIAAKRAAAWRCTLRWVGYQSRGVLHVAVPLDQLPGWARAEVMCLTCPGRTCRRCDGTGIRPERRVA